MENKHIHKTYIYIYISKTAQKSPVEMHMQVKCLLCWVRSWQRCLHLQGHLPYKCLQQLLDVISTIGFVKRQLQMFARSPLAYPVIIPHARGQPDKSYRVNNKYTAGLIGKRR